MVGAEFMGGDPAHALLWWFVLAGRGLSVLCQDLVTLTVTVSHVVAAVPDLVVPGYSVEREFGNVGILHRDADEPVRQRREHAPVIVFDRVWKTMQQFDADFPPCRRTPRSVSPRP